MPRWKRRGPASRAAASRWWPPKCARWRSGEAAREIRSLIGTSTDRAEAGAAEVEQAGHSIDEISAASTGQRDGVAQIGQALSSIDSGTQQNAVLVEESAAAAESLSAQATQLVQAVSVFRITA